MLAGISGIDASGKGFVTERLAAALRARGLSVASTSVDGWLDLPSVRFDNNDPAGNFYRRGIRMDEMFERLILPLRDRRSIRIEADHMDETASAYRKHVYNFFDIDIVLLEGIFLFKRRFVRHFDIRILIECSFQTAMARAIARSQEGLPPHETVHAYETIYFPAQRLHFDLDRPNSSADIVYPNDPN